MNTYRDALTHIRTFPNAFWVVISATFINQMGNMAFVFLVLYLTKHLGFSLSQASTAFATFCASMLLTGLLGGSLIDKMGAARVMMGALVANGFVILAFALVDTYPLILLLCLIWGMTFGLYRPASQTFISHLSAPGLHKVTFSVYRLALNLGMSIGPALGGYLAYHSFTAIFLANGLANLLGAVILIIGLTNTPWFKYRPAKERHLEFNLKWFKQDVALRLFMLGMIPISMVFYQHESTLAVFINQNLHFSLSFYGLLFTFNTLMIVFCELPLNVMTMNWPYRINFLLGSVFITLGFGGMLFAFKEWHIVALTLIWTIGEMTLYPAATSYIAEIAPEQYRGTYMSLYGTSNTLGLLLGPWAGAIVMQHLGASGLWITCAIWGVISIFIFNYTREPVTR